MNHKHQKILDQIFQHPISHDIKWNDVLKLFEALGAEIEQNHSGSTSITLKGIESNLPRHTHSKISNQHELMEIRHFLQQSGIYR